MVVVEKNSVSNPTFLTFISVYY